MKDKVREQLEERVKVLGWKNTEKSNKLERLEEAVKHIGGDWEANESA
jgi:hypothetical protein